MADAVSLKFDTRNVMAGLDAIAAAAGKVVRPTARAGALVFYEEARLRAPVSKNAHWFYGTHQKYFFKAGTLRDSIYHVFSQDNSVDGERATYHISWNHHKAPYGFMVELGTSTAAAHPFIRPTYDSMKSHALIASKNRFVELMTSENVGVTR